MCVLLEFSLEFPVDPYYEPLAWFMISYVILSPLIINPVLNRIKIAVRILLQKAYISMTKV